MLAIFKVKPPLTLIIKFHAWPGAPTRPFYFSKYLILDPRPGVGNCYIAAYYSFINFHESNERPKEESDNQAEFCNFLGRVMA